MKNLSTRTKAKTTISPELKEQQKKESARTLQFLARHFKLPAEDQLRIKEILKNQKGQIDTSSLAMKCVFLQEPVFKFVYEPPYKYTSGTYFQSAVKLDGSLSPMFELIGLGDVEKAELSVAVVTGQNHFDVYRTYLPDSDIGFMYSKEMFSEIGDQITLPGPTERKLVMVSSVEFELPGHGIVDGAEEVYRLVPGKEEQPYYGLTGALGNVYFQTSGGSQSVVTSKNFLNIFATKSAVNGSYENSFTLVNCNELPAGLQNLNFSIRTNIKSLVSRKFDAQNLLSAEHSEYALVDLRSTSLFDKKIVRNENGSLKRSGGDIKVKKLQFAFYEPESLVDPSSNHDTD